ncbi:cation:proton antiporter [Qipengyuania nanhaisediminis]|uniref:cation:proton antiporter domain-containing protein n=1 Tax=Qipengyuania nanhaisediminis TaxID=604088 RepID=UPI0038B38741
MAGESAQIVETIQPAITLLGLGIGAALVARACRLNPIVGYIGLGVVIAMLGYADNFSGPIVATLAEAGIMFLLFNLGLHFSLGRIRAESANIFGFGSIQMLVAGGGFAALFWMLGLPTQFAVIGGFAMGLSSTAVVIGLVREREQEDCPVGRAAQSILIFQDIAAIVLLVSASALGREGALLPALLDAGWKAFAAFLVAVLFARYLTEPLFRLIARAGNAEVYTATALFIALAAGWATGLAGLSLSLGAFLGGMAVADSRYRMMVQTEIEAFRGLFLSFFFISVGLSIDPAILADNWITVLAASLALIALKCTFNVLAALANQWSVPGSLQLGFLLGQGSEFALVLFAMPLVAGLVDAEPLSILVSAIAVSMAATPLVSNIGRKFAGKLRRGEPDQKLAGDDAPVVIVGMGPAGRALADALEHNGIDYIAVEADHDQFEEAYADGYGVHHALAADPRSWDSLSMRNREIVVVATGDLNLTRELRPLVEERLPDVTTILAIPTEEDQGEFEALGVRAIVTGGDHGAEKLIETVFEELGSERAIPLPGRAARLGALEPA